jgi:hypothetical protein|tara:strand:- start:3392 stop:3715 length:324 start_codon:yes stop_codon:yes gene_type:complete
VNKSSESRIIQLIVDNGGQCTKSDVYRKRIVSNAESAEVLLTAMVRAGLLNTKEVPPPLGGGHPQTLYENTNTVKETYVSTVDVVIDLKAKVKALEHRVHKLECQQP